MNEEAPLAPDVKLNPVVDATVNVPCETESVSESAFVPTAAASVIEIALLLAVEKLSELFSFTLPVEPVCRWGANSPRNRPGWKPLALCRG